MQISEQGVALIKKNEGFSAMPYLCPAGKLTVGYGHVVREGEDFSAGIEENDAENLLKQDVEAAEQAVKSLVNVPLKQNQFDALVVLAYNIGVGAFEKSTLLRDLKGGDMQSAAAQWKRWVYADGKLLNGLVNRRNEEIALFVQA